MPDTTDANGTYLYEGLSAGTYTVNVTPPSGYTQTYDPDATVDNAHTVTVSEGQSYLLADFGYQPGGVGVIGDKVFDDKNGDGIFNDADAGIDNVTVTLFEDTNGDGEVDPGGGRPDRADDLVRRRQLQLYRAGGRRGLHRARRRGGPGSGELLPGDVRLQHLRHDHAALPAVAELERLRPGAGLRLRERRTRDGGR